MSSSEKHPLSGVQHGFVAASGMKATKNTVPATYLIEGRFSTNRILEAVEAVVRRHDALRTVFGLEDGKPFQQALEILPGIANAIRVQDLRGEKGRGSTVVQKAIERYLALPFALNQAPVWRGFLFQVEDRRWVLGLTFAHVIIDGTSVGVIAGDLAAALGGTQRVVPAQVGAIAAAERAIRPTPEQQRFWTAEYQLRGALPGTWTGGDATYHVVPIPEFEPRLVAGLNRLRETRGVSVTSMLGALAGVVGKAITRGDLMIGYATAQRAREAKAGNNALTVGAIHDHLPALAVVSSAQSLVDCAAAHHERREQSRIHRLPTGHLGVIAGGTPYDVAVNFGRFGAPTPIAVDGGGTVTAVPVEAIGPVNVRRATTAAPPLAFIASTHGDGAIRGVMTGISGLYSKEEVGRFPVLMRRLALAAVADPDASIRTLLTRRS